MLLKALEFFNSKNIRNFFIQNLKRKLFYFVNNDNKFFIRIFSHFFIIIFSKYK